MNIAARISLIAALGMLAGLAGAVLGIVAGA